MAMQAMTLQNFGPQHQKSVAASAKLSGSFNTAFGSQTMVGASQQVSHKRMEIYRQGGTNAEIAPN